MHTKQGNKPLERQFDDALQRLNIKSTVIESVLTSDLSSNQKSTLVVLIVYAVTTCVLAFNKAEWTSHAMCLFLHLFCAFYVNRETSSN